MIRFWRYTALLVILGGFLAILAPGCGGYSASVSYSEGEQYETPPGAPDL